MAITYLEPENGNSRITYLERPEQTTWQAVKAALGSRPELKPYDPMSVPEGADIEHPVSEAVKSAIQTVGFPIRTGQTINQAYGIPEAIGKRTGFPATGKMVSDILPFIVGPGGNKTTVGAPTPGIGREAGVKAAEELEIPLSWSEVTGGLVSQGLESLLEKTPFGRKPISDFRTKQIAAKEGALSRASEDLGTQEAPQTIGMKAKEGYASEMDQARNLRNKLYADVPQDVHIPLKTAISTADQIIEEQSHYLPTTRNSEVVAIAKDIQNAERGISSGEGVTGGPEIKGITTDIPGKKIPASSKTVQSSLVDKSGNPLSYTEKVPGKQIPASKEYGVSYQFGPEQKFAPKPNYPLLSRLRSVLGDKIEANTITAAGGKRTLTQSGRDFMRLKSALDSDIEQFASSDTTGFGEKYKYANAYAEDFAGAYQNKDVIRMLGTDPEKVVNSIFLPKNVTEIQRFRAAIGEGPFQLAKKQFTQQLLDGKNLKLQLKKYEGILDSVYTPSEHEKLTKLSDAFDLIQSAEKQAGNPSGTGRQVLGGGSFFSAGYALKAGHPEVALAILGIPYLASKGMIAARQGVKVPLQRAGMGIGSDLGRNR